MSGLALITLAVLTFFASLYGGAALWPHLPYAVRQTLPPVACLAVLGGMLASLAAGNG